VAKQVLSVRPMVRVFDVCMPYNFIVEARAFPRLFRLYTDAMGLVARLSQVTTSLAVDRGSSRIWLDRSIWTYTPLV